MSDQRRLAAIVSVDVVGYSRLMGRDESGTLAALKALRRELVDPKIAAHGGRIVKATGDGLLLEFPSVVDSVRCVVAIQTTMSARNADIQEDRRITYRVGVNLGDIIIDGDDIFGDGVNIAARLQEIAEPGGVAISRRVHEDVRDRLDVAFEDAGERTLKNIARPVSVWRWSNVASVASALAAVAAPDGTLALPDRPSIAVLPFQNMSGDSEQEYFADGMVEDVTTALSRTRWLFVIARNSSFTYKGRAVDVKQVGRELGVRYVLEGSVRKAGQKVRITAQLIDAATGAHLWADRFDGALDDVFDLQDRVTASVAGAIRPELERAEVERARRKPTGSLDAYDLYLRALPNIEGGTREAIGEALKLLHRATELDPGFASAWAMSARCHTLRWQNGWTVDRVKDAAETARLARRAVAVGRDDAVALAYAGFAIARVLGEFDDGVPLVDRALELDPHLAAAWQFSGALRAFMGQTDEALQRIERAMRLSPRDPRLHTMMAVTSVAQFAAGKYDEAVAAAERSIRESANFLMPYRTVVAAHAQAGRLDEARRTLARLLEVDPDCRIADLRDSLPLRRPGDRARYLDGLRLAGLPE